MGWLYTSVGVGVLDAEVVEGVGFGVLITSLVTRSECVTDAGAKPPPPANRAVHDVRPGTLDRGICGKAW